MLQPALEVCQEWCGVGCGAVAVGLWRGADLLSLPCLQFDYNPQFADWTKETRGVPLIRAVPVDSWLLIYTRRNYDVANTLLQSLFKVTPSMGIRMNKPNM